MNTAAALEAPAQKLEPIDLSGATLDELAETVNREHDQAIGAMSAAVAHAVRAGEALMEVRKRFASAGEWQSWATENLPFRHEQANKYMRIAHYRDHVLGSGNVLTIAGAIEHLRGLPAIADPGELRQKEDPIRQEAIRMRKSGASLREVADFAGVALSTIRYWTDPQAKKKIRADQLARRRRDNAARKALEREERAKAVRRAGGAPAEAYANVRKCAAALDRAIDETVDPEMAAVLRRALNNAHAVEDEITKALRIP